MRRSTWITLAIFLLLLGVWLVLGRQKTSDAPPPLSVDGYIGNVGLEEARTLGQKQPAPYTHIVIQRQLDGGPEKVELDRVDTPTVPPPEADAKTPPPEPKWQLKRTFGGKTVTWKAQGFRATTMVEQLQRSIRSDFAVRVPQKGLEEYGLDAKHAIDVELSGGGKSAKFRVGLLQKTERDGQPATWVQDPARADVAYHLSDRDLRTAFDFTWNDLRDRQLLTLDMAKVDKLELTRPGEKVAKIVVQRPALEAGKTREAGDGWQIVQPEGVRTGDIGEWLKAIERLSAAEFVATSDPTAKQSGLDDPNAAQVKITSGTDSVTLTFGKSDESRPNKEVWLKMAHTDELYRVGSYQRDQVLLSIDQLRDRRLFQDHALKDLNSFEISGANGKFGAKRAGDAWSATAGQPVDPAKVTDFLSNAEKAKVDFTLDAPRTDEPEWTLLFHFGDKIQGTETTQKVTLGKEVDGQVHGQLGPPHGPFQTFKLASWAAKQLQKQATDFAPKPATEKAMTPEMGTPQP